MDLQLFLPLTKIDVEKRLVFGCIAAEVADKSGEIMDYETARPRFESWSAEIAKASDGKSVGNLRAMHGNVAAGKLETIAFDDEGRRIEACGKVVDDAEWNKVLEGVYTGFSMGGKYLKRWKDSANPQLTRYTPQPTEVSLVDNPCIPTSTFEVVKEDGSTELRKFKAAPPAATDVDAVAHADPGYQDDGQKRYPVDSEAHIRAAWSYINQKRNAARYTSEQLDRVKAKIVAAWKDKIDGNGPPSAAEKSGDESDDDAGSDVLALSEKLAGFAVAREAVAKTLADASERIDAALRKIDEQAARIDALEAQPAGGGPVVRGTQLVTKAQDAAGESVSDAVKLFKEHLDTLGPHERALALMKFSLATPLPRAPEPQGRRS